MISAARTPAKPAKAPEPVLPKPEPKPEAPVIPQKAEDEAISHNQMILNMYRKGKNAVDIAKELGLGVGEVKLVIGLFREEDL